MTSRERVTVCGACGLSASVIVEPVSGGWQVTPRVGGEAILSSWHATSWGAQFRAWRLWRIMRRSMVDGVHEDYTEWTA